MAGKLLRFLDTSINCFSRVDNPDPILISVTPEVRAIVIKQSRIGILGPDIYRTQDSGELNRLCAKLSRPVEEYSALPPKMGNVALMIFTQLALESSSAADMKSRIASALDEIS